MASPNIIWTVNRFGPLRRFHKPPTPRPIVPRQPIPRITPMGWARMRPTSDLTDAEVKIYEKARAIEQNVLSPWGVQRVERVPPLQGDEFLEAIWPLVARGLSEETGIKTSTTDDALKQAPERMRFGERTLDPYQMQDVGQLARIEREMNTAFMFHAMGLGKTLQALAICEHNRDLSDEPHQPTLIVVPPDAIMDQWLQEITKAIPDAEVWDYRLQKEEPKTWLELQRYDYVVASIFTVSREFESTRICFLDRQCRQWDEKKRTLPLTPKQKRQAAQGIEVTPKTVALTTGMPHGTLFSVRWSRVVLDEAHRLRRNSAMARAMCGLETRRILILSGMPQQNEYLDWFPLLNLARLRAFRNNIDEFKAMFRNKEDNQDWPQLDHDRRLVLSLIVRGLSSRRNASTLFNGVASNEPIPFTERVLELFPDNGTQYRHHTAYGLKKSERDYQQDTIQTWSKFESYTDENGQKHFRLNESRARAEPGNSATKHPFKQFLHSRQAAINPLILVDAPEDVARDEFASDSSDSGEDQPNAKKKLSSKEKQKRHGNWYRWMKEGQKWRSSVTDKVVEIVKEHVARKPRDPKKLESCDIMGPGGIIIFSEYIRALDVIEMAIQEELGRNCLRRDGTVKGRRKQKALDDFRKQNNAHHMILLTTAKSGDEGLNLPEAATVIQISPSFNPFLDKQAQSRPLRRGQTEHVEIYKIIMKDSLEQRIDFSQYRKTNNARGILDLDEEEWQVEMTSSGLSPSDKQSYLDMAKSIYIKKGKRGSGKKETPGPVKKRKRDSPDEEGSENNNADDQKDEDDDDANEDNLDAWLLELAESDDKHDGEIWDSEDDY